MKLFTVKSCGRSIMFSGLCVGIFLLALTSHCQTSRPSAMLNSDHLRAVGVHLPSYIGTVDDLMQYQGELQTHQQLMVEWDSIPGLQGRVKKEQVEGTPLAPNFTLLDRKQNLPGAAGKTNPLLVEDDLVVVGVTSTGEARGIRVQRDPRLWHGEYLEPGKSQERYDVVTPKVTIEVLLPDDSLVRTVVFMKPRPTSDGGWRLERVGALELSPKSSPG
jgi:hypothetical protein